MVQAIALGILGVLTGLALPLAVRPMIIRKLEARGRELGASVQDRLLFKGTLAVIMALLGAAAGYFGEGILPALLVFVIMVMSVAFALIDMRIHIIPNEMILAMIPLGILFQLVVFGIKGFLLSLACMAGIVLLFMIVGLIFGLEKVGAGDVKLAGIMGLTLGYPLMLYGILIMAVLLILYSLGGIILGKLTHVSMFPFAPFMMSGQVVALLLYLTGAATLL